MTEHRPGHFATTNWSMILAAGGNGNDDTRAALEELCLKYWSPLYVFVRRRGLSEADAKDTVQSFILDLLVRDDLQSVDPAKGRFRTFILAAISNFLGNQLRSRSAQKRGGSIRHISIDMCNAEDRLALVSGNPSPEQAFDKEWGLSVIHSVLNELRNEFVSAEKEELFNALSHLLIGDTDSFDSYQTIGQRIGLTESAVKSTVYRMRHRYRQLLRNQIGQTVAVEDEIDEEIRLLFDAVRKH